MSQREGMRERERERRPAGEIALLRSQSFVGMCVRMLCFRQLIFPLILWGYLLDTQFIGFSSSSPSETDRKPKFLLLPVCMCVAAFHFAFLACLSSISRICYSLSFFLSLSSHCFPLLHKRTSNQRERREGCFCCKIPFLCLMSDFPSHFSAISLSPLTLFLLLRHRVFVSVRLS